MKYLSHLDLNKVCELRNSLLDKSNVSGFPSSPVEGQIAYNTLAHGFGTYSGYAWLSLKPTDGYSYPIATGTYGYADTCNFIPHLSGDLTNQADPGGNRNIVSISASYKLPVSQLAAYETDSIMCDKFMITSHTGTIGNSSKIGLTYSVTESENGNIDMYADGVNRKRIVNLADPVNDYDAVNKRSLDNAVAGLKDYKDSVLAASVSNISNLAAANVSNIDTGVTIANGVRLLIKDQTTTAQNGIYVVSNYSSPTFTLTRAPDANATGELSNGTYVWVEKGTTSGASAWIVNNTSASTPVIDTDPITWSQFSATNGNYTAAAPIKITGSSIGLDYDGVTLGLNSGILVVKPQNTWSEKLALVNGGTNADLSNSTTYPVGSLIVKASTTAFGTINPATEDRRILLSTANGTPTWSAYTFPTTFPADGLLYGIGSNSVGYLGSVQNSVLVTNGSAAAAWARDIPSGVTIGGKTPFFTDATIAVGNGGTGATTLTNHGLLVGSGTSAVRALTVGATNNVLLAQSTADPIWGQITASHIATGAVIKSIAGTANQIVATNVSDAVTLTLPNTVHVPGVNGGATATLTASEIWTGTYDTAARVLRLDASGNLTSIPSLTMSGAATIKSGTTAGNTITLQAYDTDGAAYTSFITLTAGTTPTCNLAAGVTIENKEIYRVGGATDVSVSDGGTGRSSLTAYQVLCGGTSSTSGLQSVASDTTTTKYLKNGGASALPTWAAIAVSDISGSIVTSVTGTTNQVTVTGTTTPVISLPSALYAPGTVSTSGLYTGTAGTAGTLRLDSNGSLQNIVDLNITSGTTTHYLNLGGANSTESVLIRAYKTDTTAGYVNVLEVANGTASPTANLASFVTLGSKYIYRADGTDIPVADGGTGRSTLSSYNLLVGAGTSAVGMLGPSSTAGALLCSAGASANPTWTTAAYPTGAITSGSLLYASAANTIGTLSASANKILTCSAGSVPTWSDTLPSSTKLTTPLITTAIYDTNGNVILGLSPIATPTNYIYISNNVTGSAPIIGVNGSSDTNQSLLFSPKVTGTTSSSWGRLTWKDAATNTSLQVLSLVRRWSFTLLSTTVMRDNNAIGTLSTSVAIKHNFGTRDVVVVIRDSSGAQVWADVVFTDSDTVTLQFTTAPTDGDAYQVLIVG